MTTIHSRNEQSSFETKIKENICVRREPPREGGGVALGQFRCSNDVMCIHISVSLQTTIIPRSQTRTGMQSVLPPLFENLKSNIKSCEVARRFNITTVIYCTGVVSSF